jgi:tetratricopeptide (TPR) repeat protein
MKHPVGWLALFLVHAQLGLAAEAAAPVDSASAVAPPATATDALATLERGRLALKASDYVAAGQAMDGIVRMSGFDALDPRIQFRTRLFAGIAAAGRRDFLSAHEWLIAATQYEEADAGVWLRRAGYADTVDALPDAVVALEQVAARWPSALVENQARRELVDRVTFQLQRDHLHRADYLRLAKALFDARYTRDLDTQPDGVWSDLILEALAHQDDARAAELALRIENTDTILAMRVDKRFDALVRADLKRFDLREAMHRTSKRLEERMAAEPRRLEVVVRYLSALRDQGRFREALGISAAALEKIEKGSAEFPAYDDLGMSLNWLYNHRARMFASLGRWDDAVATMETGSRQLEHGSDNVSQAINLAAQYNDAGRPRQALAALEGIDWSRGLSPYGRMQFQAARYDAYLQLEDEAAAEQVLAYLREHHEDAESTWQYVMLESGDEDGAAAALIARLNDTTQRGEALAAVQIYPGHPRTKRMKDMHDRWTKLVARADVRATIDDVGRIEKVPVHD